MHGDPLGDIKNHGEDQQLEDKARGDGLEFCQQLAADPKTGGIPVVMLTARGHKVPSAELERTNIKCFLDKPFSTRHLIVQINELLLLPSDESIPLDDAGLSAA